jgi:stage II sporulation protein AA (anti-sigma F factor antagonist)
MIDYNEINLNIDVLPAQDNYQVVEFKGNLDKIGLYSVKEKLEQLVEQFQKQYLIFNFENLEFANSESIGLLLVLHARLVKKNQKIVLVGSKSHVKDVFEVIGLTKIIDCFDSLKAFLDSIKG